MRIAIVTDTFPPEVNGVAKTIGRLAAHLEKRGIPARIYAPGYRGHVESDPRVHRSPSIPFPLYSECRLSWPPYFRMKRELREFQPTLVHIVTEFNLGLAGFRAARKLGIPIVSSYHTNFSQYTRHYRLGFLERGAWAYLRWFHNKCLATFCPSPTTKAELEAVGMQNVRIWSRGIDAQSFSPSKRDTAWRRQLGIDDKVVLLYVGRLGAEKGVGVLLDALRLLNEKHRDKIHLVMVGDGPSRAAFEKAAPPNVTFTGFRSGEELWSAFASGDVFAFASVTETFGNVVIEAMASGLPVVAAAAGGPIDIVREGVTGYLFAPGDPQAMAAKLEPLILDADLRHRLSRQAVEYAGTQSWDGIFDQLLADYADVLAKVS